MINQTTPKLNCFGSANTIPAIKKKIPINEKGIDCFKSFIGHAVFKKVLKQFC